MSTHLLIEVTLRQDARAQQSAHGAHAREDAKLYALWSGAEEADRRRRVRCIWSGKRVGAEAVDVNVATGDAAWQQAINEVNSSVSDLARLKYAERYLPGCHAQYVLDSQRGFAPLEELQKVYNIPTEKLS